MIPKGKLLIIGGHEDKGEIPGENLTIHRKKKCDSHFEILGTVISKIPRAHHIIEIIAAASSIHEEMEQLYIASYKQAGFTQVGIIKIESHDDANSTALIKRIQGAHAVFFTGGDQNKLITLLADSDLLKAITRKYYADQHFLVGGTSAGAMAIPEISIAGGIVCEALYKEDIKLSSGFGMIRNVIVDTHFIKRGRIARLAHAVLLHPECLGIGLGEDTALLISEGNSAECIGTGMVILLDGSKIIRTNVNEANNSTPIVAENLIMSILAEGCTYFLEERKCGSRKKVKA